MQVTLLCPGVIAEDLFSADLMMPKNNYMAETDGVVNGVKCHQSKSILKPVSICR